MFLDLKAAFDSVDREALFHCMLTQGVPPKYVNILKALYSHTTGRVGVYGQLGRCFGSSSGVRQGCPLSPFLFNFVIDDIMEQALHNSATKAPEAHRNKILFDLEYADDIVCSLETFAEAQTLLDSLIHSAARYGLKFAPSKCKLMLFNWTGPIQPLLTEGEELEQVDKFTYLGSCISANGSIEEEISARIARAQAAFSNLRHLWRRRDIPLTTKGRVYNATVRPTLLYGCETWALRSEDVHSLLVFDHRCLRSIGHFYWKQRLSNKDVRQRILGFQKQSRRLDQIILGTRMRWLGHVLRMENSRLPRKFLLSEPEIGWKRSRGSQVMTWYRGMKEATRKLAAVGQCRLPEWGPRDSAHKWLFTLEDMARDRCQWRSCCNFLIDLHDS